MVSESGVAGVNFWGWGGYAEPAHRAWEPGDDYTGDPAQEDQGLNSVFATDKSTLEIIRECFRNDHRRLSLALPCFFKSAENFFKVMAVDLHDIPAKGRKFFGDRRYRDNILVLTVYL